MSGEPGSIPTAYYIPRDVTVSRAPACWNTRHHCDEIRDSSHWHPQRLSSNSRINNHHVLPRTLSRSPRLSLLPMGVEGRRHHHGGYQGLLSRSYHGQHDLPDPVVRMRLQLRSECFNTQQGLFGGSFEQTSGSSIKGTRDCTRKLPQPRFPTHRTTQTETSVSAS